jgi:hypothetical protein
MTEVLAVGMINSRNTVQFFITGSYWNSEIRQPFSSTQYYFPSQEEN